jgi:hypothetical protein
MDQAQGAAMALWKVRTKEEAIFFGSRGRKKLDPYACNEPYLCYYWCPYRKWFMRRPCPFLSKHECETYILMCGML